MGEYDFQNEVLQQLGRIEAKQDTMYDELRTQQADIKELREDTTKALQSAKAAHHRINFIMAILGAMGTAVGYIVFKIIFP